MTSGGNEFARPPGGKVAALDPELSARTVFSALQVMAAGVLSVGLIAALALAPGPVLVALAAAMCGCTVLGVVHLLVVVAAGARSRAHVVAAPELREDDLPTYTVLAPLYHEGAVVGGLVRALSAIDYPVHLLEIKLIIEHDDHETRDALAQVELPAHISLLELPDGQPKTKPRACNVALRQVNTELVVIFDAEDRPEPDQLRKAAAVLHAAPANVACVQAHLDFWNPRTNLLTRFVACEYSTTWEMFRPGLDRLGAPLPLGGTSNHFPTALLRGLGAWDDYNVTEDIDLGLRLARAGYHSWMLDSTTYEEANSAVGNWIRQRSRWMKGWLQTWLVHNRHPLRLIREVGGSGALHFHLTVLIAIMGVLFTPVVWVLGGLRIADWYVPIGLPGWLLTLALATMVLGAVATIPSTLVGLQRRRHRGVGRVVVLMPLYEALKTIAAVKAIWQLLTRPHYWEKTTHGLEAEPEDAALGTLAAGMPVG